MILLIELLFIIRDYYPILDSSWYKVPKLLIVYYYFLYIKNILTIDSLIKYMSYFAFLLLTGEYFKQYI